MASSIKILLFFFAGLLLSYADMLPEILSHSQIDSYLLYLLMTLVGVSIGLNESVKKAFSNLNFKIIALPVVSIIGTLVGASAISFAISDLNYFQTLAVASGFGYYSLSSILLNDLVGPELGTIALLTNIFRELATLVGAPLLIYFFGKLAPIAAGGATTIDTSLPIISKYSGQEYVIFAIVNGIVLEVSVPFLVSIFGSLSL